MLTRSGPSQQFVRITIGSATGLIIGLIPKSGFTSIRASLLPDYAEKVWRHEIGNQPVRIYIRHPLQRLVSAYRFLSTGRPGIIPDSCTFEQFIDIVLDPADIDNSHWLPQVAWFAEYNITEIYQFERIAETWPPEFELEHLNRSTSPVPDIGYRMDEITAYYAADLRTWNDSANHTATQ